MNTSDRIEKQLTLHAPNARVWKAIANAREFGRWFGIELAGDFVAGATLTATFNGGIDEAAIIAQQQKLGLSPAAIRLPGKNVTFCTVERIEPPRYFSFRWIPYGIDAEADPDNEAMTLVEFRLQPVAEGTLLTIVESGFDRIPAHRRVRAFRMNEAGWAGQAENIKQHVERD